MRPTRLIAMLVVGLACLPPQAEAHHGGGIEWNRTITGTVSGTVTATSLRFPHVSFTIEVEENGVKSPWIVTHNATPTMLRERGWTRDSIKPGDKVTVTYIPHVSKPRVVQMNTVTVNGKALPLL